MDRAWQVVADSFGEDLGNLERKDIGFLTKGLYVRIEGLHNVMDDHTIMCKGKVVNVRDDTSNTTSTTTTTTGTKRLLVVTIALKRRGEDNNNKVVEITINGDDTVIFYCPPDTTRPSLTATSNHH